MKKLLIVAAVVSGLFLTGCNSNQVLTGSGKFKQLYQSGDGGANSDVHVYEDLVTGDLMYLMDNSNYFQVVSPSKDQLVILRKNGYEDVLGH